MQIYDSICQLGLLYSGNICLYVSFIIFTALLWTEEGHDNRMSYTGHFYQNN